MDNQDMDNQELPRILWCGPAVHPEMQPMFEWCRLHYPLIWRKSVPELLGTAHPFVTHIILERLDRATHLWAKTEELQQQFPGAQWAFIEGALGAGRGRSMSPDGFGTRIPWHSLPARLKRWLAPAPPSKLVADAATRAGHRKLIVLFASRPETMDWLAEALSQQNLAAVTSPAENFPFMHGMTAALWDESAVERMGPACWRASTEKLPATVTQFFLTSFPTWELQARLRRAKITLVSKPFDPLDLVSHLDDFAVEEIPLVSGTESVV